MSAMTKSAAPADVTIKLKKMNAQKLEDASNHKSKVLFNVGMSLEEISRRSDSIELSFEFTIETEPSIARISVGGFATLNGSTSEIEKMLVHDPNTNVPNVLTPIYQEVYPALFMIVSTLDLPYPSPALLSKPHIGMAKPPA